MSKEENKVDLTLNPVFEPLFMDNLDDPRYYQVYGGRGSGKSFAVALAMVRKTYSPYKHKILYLRQTMTSSEDSTIADIRSAIALLGAEADFREARGTITNLVTGATITFKGIKSAGSQTAKLKSLSGITTLVVEEAEEVESFEEFSKVDESIRIKGKPLKVVLIYNPTSAVTSWIHKEWFTNGYPKEDRYIDTMFIHSTYLDNLDNLAQSTIEQYERLKETNPIYYLNTILAEWTVELEGRVYDGWGMYPIFEEEGDTWYGLDFAYGGNDRTACVKVTWLDDVYYVEEMFSIKAQKISDTVKSLIKSRVPFNAKIFADSAMPLLITDIREKGFTNIRKARKGNVEAGIKKIQDKRIVIIGDNTSHLYKSYIKFSRDKKGKLPHEPDELAATRYAINSKKPIKNPGKPKPRRARRKKGFL